MILSVIVIGNNTDLKSNDNVEIKYTDGTNIQEVVSSCTGKFISFVKEGDTLSENYLDTLLDKINNTIFDLCFINYKVLYDTKNIKECTNGNKLLYKCYYGDYIWCFLFKRDLFLKLFSLKEGEFNEAVDKIFSVVASIETPIYYHNPRSKRLINSFFFNDIKDELRFKNAIYLGSYISGKFNGYITWLLNIGRCFKNKDITLIYDSIKDVTYKRMKQYFNMVEYTISTNYVCDKLITTYSNYYYPKNFIPLYNATVFIHGDLSYFYTNNISPYRDDIYNDYYAVSKTSRDGAVGHLPTNDIKYMMNPIKIPKDLIKPHLTLVSTLRASSKIKGIDRIVALAGIFDELNIPYTWNVFTDIEEGTNKNGLIYRSRVLNPMPYVNDADYVVLLSDTEACSYSVLEAIEVETKLVLTPLESFKEIGLDKSENVIMIPFSYFEKENKDKLKEVALKIYNEKDKKEKYNIDYEFMDDYDKLFLD